MCVYLLCVCVLWLFLLSVYWYVRYVRPVVKQLEPKSMILTFTRTSLASGACDCVVEGGLGFSLGGVEYARL